MNFTTYIVVSISQNGQVSYGRFASEKTAKQVAKFLAEHDAVESVQIASDVDEILPLSAAEQVERVEQVAAREGSGGR